MNVKIESALVRLAAILGCLNTFTRSTNVLFYHLFGLTFWPEILESGTENFQNFLFDWILSVNFLNSEAP